MNKTIRIKISHNDSPPKDDVQKTKQIKQQQSKIIT